MIINTKWVCRVNQSPTNYFLIKVSPSSASLSLSLPLYPSAQDLPLWGRQRVPADNALPLHRKPELRAPVVSQPVDQILGHPLLRTLQVWLRHGDEAQTSTQGRASPSQAEPGPAVDASSSHSLRCHPSLLQWEKLHMTKSERRKIFCSVMFHVIAIVCMLWSVYVLVRRTAEELRLGKNGQLAPTSPPSTPLLHSCHSVSQTRVLTGSHAV